MNQSDQIDIGDMIFYGVIAILVIAIVAVIIILFEVLIYDSRPVKGTVVAKDFEPSRLENTTSTRDGHADRRCASHPGPLDPLRRADRRRLPCHPLRQPEPMERDRGRGPLEGLSRTAPHPDRPLARA